MDREAFNRKLRSTALPVIVDVWAPWCGPCRLIEPSLKKLAQEYQERVEVWKINADENIELVRSLGIYGIPALLVFRGEQELARTTGAQPLSSLARLFETALNGEPAPKIGISLQDRLLRGVIGFGLIATAWWLDLSLLIYAAGGIVLFTAVYDRCPIWQALSPRLASLVGRLLPSQFKSQL